MFADSFIGVLAFLSLCVIVGATLLYCATVIRSSLNDGPRHGIRMMILVGGWLLVVLAMGVVVAATIAFIMDGNFDIKTVVFSLAAALFAGIIALGGVMILSAPGYLPEGSRTTHRSLSHHLKMLTFLGTSFLFLPALALAPASLLLISAIELVTMHLRRVRQQRLLWILAIAADKNTNLTDEIDAYAETLTGQEQTSARGVADAMRSGLTLSVALERHPYLLPRSAILAIHYGEQSGQMGRVLRDEAVRFANRIRPAKSALSFASFTNYACSLLTVVVLIVGFLMYYIVPKFKKLFQDFDVELPGPTEQLIYVSDVFVNYFLLFAILSIAFAAAGSLIKVGFRRGWANLKLPWLTRWFPRADTPQVLRSLAEGVRESRPLHEVLMVVSTYHHRAHIRERTGRAQLAIEAGLDPWRALEQEGLIRHSERNVLESAARVGNLFWALNVLADNLERRRDFRWQWWLEAVRPLLVIGVGLIVGFVCVAVFFPLVQLIWDLT